MAAPITSRRLAAQSTQPKKHDDLYAERLARQQDYRQVSQAVNGMVITGTLAQRPPSAVPRFYFATDTAKLYFDNGLGTWVQIN